MSVTQLGVNDTGLNERACPRCGAVLPVEAAFCNVCGERLDSMKNLTTLLEQEEDIATRYRITSLVRRQPLAKLYFALDFQQTASQGQSRMVVIRDIDITSLSDAALIQAVKLAQQEYDLLRRSDIPGLTPAVELRFSQGHLFLVANQPPASPSPSGLFGENGGAREKQDGRLTTLQDYLQSGQGLPSAQHALHWIEQLCETVDGLHQRHITIGDLDPFAVLYSGDMRDPGSAQLALLVSWLPPGIRALLPLPPLPTSSFYSYFVAPEVTQGTIDARSDVYSLGAILYLLLTGMPPGESMLRNRTRRAALRPPHEINGQLSSQLSECVMQALALQPDDRFDSASAFAAALSDPQYRRPITSVEHAATGDEGSEVETIRIFPLSWKDVERWRATRRAARVPAPQEAQSPVSQAPLSAMTTRIAAPATTSATPVTPRLIPQRPMTPLPSLPPEEAQSIEVDWLESRPSSSPVPPSPLAIPETPPANLDTPPSSETMPEEQAELHSEESEDDQPTAQKPAPVVLPLVSRPPQITQDVQSAAPGWKQRINGITGLLPAISTSLGQSRRALHLPQIQSRWFEQFKQALLGQQQQVITAAAIVETPLRVLPDQMFTLRIHVIGRNEPGQAAQRRARDGEVEEMSLSRLVSGDTVLIEVRSVLQQSHAYLLQRASVTIPAEGYVAEVTIPMQSLTSAPTGRRDRLHIYFMDEHHHPLYEKPFAVEIFVSNHVKRGNEGHHVLTIPL